jgi:hypothetical protein
VIVVTGSAWRDQCITVIVVTVRTWRDQCISVIVAFAMHTVLLFYSFQAADDVTASVQTGSLIIISLDVDAACAILCFTWPRQRKK